MDGIFTILLYVGALVLIGLVKSISKSGKKKPNISPIFSAVEEEKTEDFFNPRTIFDFLQENSSPPPIEKEHLKTKSIDPFLNPQNEGGRSTKVNPDSPISLAEKESSFIFGDFNLPAAIVYSEILKRPDY